jgi:hypothetical protein
MVQNLNNLKKFMELSVFIIDVLIVLIPLTIFTIIKMKRPDEPTYIERKTLMIDSFDLVLAEKIKKRYCL